MTWGAFPLAGEPVASGIAGSAGGGGGGALAGDAALDGVSAGGGGSSVPGSSGLSGSATLADIGASGLVSSGEQPTGIETLGYVSNSLGRQWYVSWRENGWIWPSKFVAERVTAKFDFTKDLPFGDTIATLALAVTTVSGADGNPTAVLAGAPVIKGGRVFQQLGDGIGNCVYFVQCQVTTAQGNIFVLAGVLPVQPL